MAHLAPLTGVIPAHLLPFTADLEIDEPSLRRHLRALLDVDGVTGITTNAHASEVATLDRTEQRRLLDIVLDEVGGEVPVLVDALPLTIRRNRCATVRDKSSMTMNLLQCDF